MKKFPQFLKTNFKKIYKSVRKGKGKTGESCAAPADGEKKNEEIFLFAAEGQKRRSQKMNEETFCFCVKKNQKEKKSGKNGRMC